MSGANDVLVRPKQRSAGLDLLRLVAIALVLGRHLEAPPEHLPSMAKSFLEVWARGGWVGVDLFFVLSGFLVSGLLFAEFKAYGRISVGRFYVRRGWKIYPPFFALIGATILMTFWSGNPVGRSQIGSELLFLQCYVPGLWNHTWSLSVEEHFYLLLPLLLLGILRVDRESQSPFRAIPAIALGLAVAALVARILNLYLRSEYSNQTHYLPTHLRIDSLFFGVAISYFYEFHGDALVGRLGRWRRYLMAAGVFLLSPPFLVAIETSPIIYTLGFTVFYLASGMLLLGVILCRPPASRFVLGLATLGAFSYSIYLWHMPVLAWGLPAIEKVLGAKLPFGVRLGLYLAGSVAFGVVMAKLIEVPALRLRDRLFPPASPARSPGEGATNPRLARVPDAMTAPVSPA